MPDFMKRKKEAKPDANTQEFIGVVQDLKKECDERIQEICSSSNLQKRVEAYQNFDALKEHYRKRIAALSKEHQKKIDQALSHDKNRMDQKLQSTPISIYFEINGLHIPIYHPDTKTPFTLLEFFQTPYLTDQEVAFTAHLPELNTDHLKEYFPGIEQLEEKPLEQIHPYQHLLLKTDNVAYDIFFKGKKGWDIEGKGRLRYLSKHLHFDIPNVPNPGHLDDLFKQIIEGAKND